MMRVTAVHTNANVQTDNTRCLLANTDGFFYIALPLAYYTIQQFEVVNDALNYLWAPARHDVRQMLRELKANMKNLTADV